MRDELCLRNHACLGMICEQYISSFYLCGSDQGIRVNYLAKQGTGKTPDTQALHLPPDQSVWGPVSGNVDVADRPVAACTLYRSTFYMCQV